MPYGIYGGLEEGRIRAARGLAAGGSRARAACRRASTSAACSTGRSLEVRHSRRAACSSSSDSSRRLLELHRDRGDAGGLAGMLLEQAIGVESTGRDRRHAPRAACRRASMVLPAIVGRALAGERPARRRQGGADPPPPPFGQKSQKSRRADFFYPPHPTP
jgi:hypothetical protein